MNRQPDRESAARIETYLDQVFSRLQEMPQSRRVELREELRQHLQYLAGRPGEPDHGVETALELFGNPHHIGELLARDWEEQESDTGPLSWRERVATVRAEVSGRLRAQSPLQRALDRLAGLVLLGAIIVSPAYIHELPAYFLAHQHQLQLFVNVLYPILSGSVVAIRIREALRQGRLDMRTRRELVARVALMTLPYLVLSSGTHSPTRLLVESALLICGALGVLTSSCFRSRRARQMAVANSLYGLLLGALVFGGYFAVMSIMGMPHGLWSFAVKVGVFYGLGQWLRRGSPAATPPTGTELV